MCGPDTAFADCTVRKFAAGWTEVDDALRSKRFSTSTNPEMVSAVEEDVLNDKRKSAASGDYKRISP